MKIDKSETGRTEARKSRRTEKEEKNLVPWYLGALVPWWQSF